jgi:hypothetical protein
MEGLTRLVSESLARHGFDRPLDYRRLQWSRWFRCDSHHSLLFVPSKPGVFAIAEEIMDLDTPTSQPSNPLPDPASRRMLAVTQFYEAEDMAFVLDRMLSFQNPMRARLESGRYFVRFVVIEELSQRNSIASALNQWIISSAEKVTGIGSHFATSLELTPATEYIPPVDDRQAVLFDDGQLQSPRTHSAADGSMSEGLEPGNRQDSSSATPPLNSGAASNIHHPYPFPSGF